MDVSDDVFGMTLTNSTRPYYTDTDRVLRLIIHRATCMDIDHFSAATRTAQGLAETEVTQGLLIQFDLLFHIIRLNPTFAGTAAIIIPFWKIKVRSD